MDNFSEFVGLYPAKTVSTLEFVKAFLSWVGIFGVPKVLRSNEGSQFSSYMVGRLKILLKYQHIIVVPYHPQAKGVRGLRHSMVERRMKEVGTHLRALVYEYRNQIRVESSSAVGSTNNQLHTGWVDWDTISKGNFRIWPWIFQRDRLGVILKII